MSGTVSDFILQRLNDWGVKRIYGYPGDGINGLIAGVHRAEDAGKVEFIQTRHEEMAAFMACAHAKFTGQGRELFTFLMDSTMLKWMGNP